MNDRSFEDCERTLGKIKLLFFNTLYLYTSVFVSPLVIKYHDFLVLFAPIHHVYLGRLHFYCISITYKTKFGLGIIK